MMSEIKMEKYKICFENENVIEVSYYKKNMGRPAMKSQP